MVRARHIPIRTCIACRRKRAKRELIRLVRTPEGCIEVDPRGKRSGRGAYVCADGDCLAGALVPGRLGQALRCPVSAADVETLQDSLAVVAAADCGSHDEPAGGPMRQRSRASVAGFVVEGGRDDGTKT